MTLQARRLAAGLLGTQAERGPESSVDIDYYNTHSLKRTDNTICYSSVMTGQSKLVKLLFEVEKLYFQE